MADFLGRLHEFSRLLQALAGGCLLAAIASTFGTPGAIAAALIGIATTYSVHEVQQLAVRRIAHAESISSRGGVR